MCDILGTFGSMARDEIKTTIMGENYHPGNWRDTPTTKEEKPELIHSGHFMVSDPFKEGQPETERRPGYNFQKYATSSTSETYRFNQPDLEIDSSFAKLFECLNLAYTGCNIVSPKWKSFKGQKVRLQEQIRLNNAIWREWHNQFINKKKPFLCHFSTPALENEFTAPSAVVLEGKYGKRTTTAVIGEYQRWRAFYLKQKRKAQEYGESMDTSQSASFSDKDFFSATGQAPMILDEDTLLSEFSDTLFSSLNQSFIFPNPREFSHAGVNVDAIQPGLVGLQPPLEEMMDTLDVLPEMRVGNQNEPFVFTAGNQSNFQNDLSAMLQTQQPTLPPLQPQLQTNNLDQMLVTSDLLNQNDNSLTSQDLNTLLMDQSQPSMVPQVQPPSLIRAPPQQQLPQQPNAATSVVLTPQLLGQLLQMQQQQQQQQHQVQQTSSQKNTTALLNLDNTLLSGFNLNIGSGTMQGTGAFVLQTQQPVPQQQQQQQQHRPQQQTLQQALQQQLNHPLVPIKLTRAMDVDNPTNRRTTNQSSLQMPAIVPKNQNKIVIHQQDVRNQVGSSGGRSRVGSSGGMLGPQQLQLLQQSAQNIIQQQASTMSKSGQTNYMQDFDMTPVSSPAPSPAPVPTSRSRTTATASQQPPSNAAAQRKTAEQTQALKLLQKVASHVSQNNSSNMNLFSEEQKTIFNRIFSGEVSEPGQSSRATTQQRQAQVRQSKTPPCATTQPKQVQQRTVVFQTSPVGSTNAGTTTAGVQKDSHRKARMKQTVVTKKPILRATNKAGGSALLTHLLTGGKYDSASGIILKTPTTAKTAVTSPTVTKVVVTTAQDHSRTIVPKQRAPVEQPTTIIAARGTTARVVSLTSTTVANSNNLTGETSSVFTIGATGFTPPELKRERADSSEDKNVVTAEQRRRTNIRSGFECLHQLIPSVSQSPNSKVSKAAMLQKSVEYIKKLQAEKSHLSEEMKLLKEEIDALNTAISESQSQLPASGVPVTRQRYDQMRDSFDEYVRERTEQNWKFWIFSIIIRPLFESFNATVSTASREELCRTVLSWLDRHCSLLALRPTVLSSLTLLSRITSILSDPTQVPQQAVQAVHKRDRANSAD